MRLSAFAQDSLLSQIYQILDIEPGERTVMESEILGMARRHDQQPPEWTVAQFRREDTENSVERAAR